jgi:16S rRNA (cytosine1402-N4)-methyltransferase
VSQELHRSVLLHGAVDALITTPAGIYVDGTFGRGGHSREILKRLDANGRLIGIDKDPQAIAEGQNLMAQDSRFQIAQASFAQMKDVLTQHGLPQVDGHVQLDGVLLDLGVSSPQLDQAERGFSFLRDGPLDMRMNPQAGLSAAAWLAVADEQTITRVLFDFGEEKFARRIARSIVATRGETPLTTTAQLAELIAAAVPVREPGKHPATRSFQAFRIFINNELDDLQQLLDEVIDQLAPGGRLVVISFHSLEDRLVKRFIRDQERGPKIPAHIPMTAQQYKPRLRAVGKAQKANDDEIADNVRARSAIMRVAEKTV